MNKETTMGNKQKSAKDIAYDKKVNTFLDEEEGKARALTRKLYDWLFRIGFEDPKRNKEQKARAIKLMETRKLL